MYDRSSVTVGMRTDIHGATVAIHAPWMATWHIDHVKPSKSQTIAALITAIVGHCIADHHSIQPRESFGGGCRQREELLPLLHCLGAPSAQQLNQCTCHRICTTCLCQERQLEVEMPTLCVGITQNQDHIAS